MQSDCTNVHFSQSFWSVTFVVVLLIFSVNLPNYQILTTSIFSLPFISPSWSIAKWIRRLINPLKLALHFPRFTRHFSCLPNRSGLDDLNKVDRCVFVNRTFVEGVALLIMNYQQKKNALSKVFVEDLSAALHELEQGDKSKVVILCSLVSICKLSFSDLCFCTLISLVCPTVLL